MRAIGPRILEHFFHEYQQLKECAVKKISISLPSKNSNDKQYAESIGNPNSHISKQHTLDILNIEMQRRYQKVLQARNDVLTHIKKQMETDAFLQEENQKSKKVIDSFNQYMSEQTNQTLLRQKMEMERDRELAREKKEMEERIKALQKLINDLRDSLEKNKIEFIKRFEKDISSILLKKFGSEDGTIHITHGSFNLHISVDSLVKKLVKISMDIHDAALEHHERPSLEVIERKIEDGIRLMVRENISSTDGAEADQRTIETIAATLSDTVAPIAVQELDTVIGANIGVQEELLALQALLDVSIGIGSSLGVEKSTETLSTVNALSEKVFSPAKETQAVRAVIAVSVRDMQQPEKIESVKENENAPVPTNHRLGA